MVPLDNRDGINSADRSLASINEIGHRPARTAANRADYYAPRAGILPW
jgi:hypothetical protein